MDLHNFETFRGQQVASHHSRQQLLSTIAELEAELRSVHQREQMLTEANKILNKVIVNNNQRHQQRNPNFLTHLEQIINKSKKPKAKQPNEHSFKKVDRKRQGVEENRSQHKRVYTQQSNDENDYRYVNFGASGIREHLSKQKKGTQRKWND